jgi:hypothetical protein
MRTLNRTDTTAAVQRQWDQTAQDSEPGTNRTIFVPRYRQGCLPELAELRRLGVDPVPSRLIWHEMRRHVRQVAVNRRPSLTAAVGWCALRGC